MLKTIPELELAVVQAAMAEHCGCAPETCGGSRLDPCPLANAINALMYACKECDAGGHTCPGDGNPIPHGAGDCGKHAELVAKQKLIWVPRTWADVRPGDDVRLPGTDNTAHVQHAVHQHWHVDPRTGTAGWNPPQPLQWSGVQVELRPAAAPDQPAHLTMDPAKPVEIHLTQIEADAIELMGWSNRVGLIADGS